MEGIEDLFDVDPLAVIEQAESFAVQHRSPAFVSVREAYSQVRVDVAAEATRLARHAELARHAYANRRISQAISLTEQAEVATTVERVDRWVAILGAAISIALLDGHPLAKRLETMFLRGVLPEQGYREGVQDLLQILITAQSEPVSALNLPPGFAEEGQALWTDLFQNRQEAVDAESARMMHGVALRLHLDEITRILRRLHVAHRGASLVAGAPLVGFELGILRAAASVRARAPVNEAPLPSAPPARVPNA